MHMRPLGTALMRLGLTTAAWAVLNAPAHGQAPVPVKVTVSVAGRTQTLRGTGQCRHEPQGYLYGARAALWMAEYDGSATGSRVSLTYWRPKTGAADQFQLSVTRDGKAHVINTIRGARPAGKGRSAFRPTALGGRFEISGTAQDGAALQATIECARFGGIVAEGG